MSWNEVIIVVLSIFYIYFAIRNQPVCFVFGAIASSIWAYYTYFHLLLFFDALLQVFYVIMSFLGIFQWIRGGKGGKQRHISTLSIHQHIGCIVIGIIISLFFAGIVVHILPVRMPYLDALTTAFSIMATLMLVYRKIDNWMYFVAVNTGYVYIYVHSQSLVLALIMVVYLTMAVIGYYQWKKLMNPEN
ncbi:MAG TPA: nicotinamide riboside transporter PnuC [Saprospiraceae bacterium]|nr:nicotinamide riboside transporter PnuC [Saprospiraceae bacterium]